MTPKRGRSPALSPPHSAGCSLTRPRTVGQWPDLCPRGPPTSPRQLRTVPFPPVLGPHALTPRCPPHTFPTLTPTANSICSALKICPESGHLSPHPHPVQVTSISQGSPPLACPPLSPPSKEQPEGRWYKEVTPHPSAAPAPPEAPKLRGKAPALGLTLASPLPQDPGRPAPLLAGTHPLQGLCSHSYSARSSLAQVFPRLCLSPTRFRFNVSFSVRLP